MPSPVRYRCATLTDRNHPTRLAGEVTMQTAKQAANVWGSEVGLTEGQGFVVTPVRWGARPTYWEWRVGSAWSYSLAHARIRFPAANI